MRYMHTALIILSATAVGFCGDPLGPLLRGTRYDLRSINGRSLPWSTGPGFQILEGWIKVDNDSIAERYEKTASVVIADWTKPGRYTLRDRVLIIDYRPGWCTCAPGPSYPVDTFYVSGNGLVRRELYSPDSIVRYYAPNSFF